MAAETKATIGGQNIGLLFGLPAIEYIQMQIAGLVGSTEMTFNVMQMVHIIYGGYKNYCKAENIEEALSFRAFYDYVEDSAMKQDMSEVVRIVKLFAGSKELVEKPGKDGEKKSISPSTGKKLRRSA